MLNQNNIRFGEICDRFQYIIDMFAVHYQLSDMRIEGPTVVAIPVKNEEAMVGACLDALAAQTHEIDEVILLLNNCMDRTSEICHAHTKYLGKIRIVERNLYGSLATAGEARRLALEYAISIAGDGLILTTDADAVPNPLWIERNLLEINKGADVVCGMAEIHPAERINYPQTMRSDDERVCFLLSILDNINTLVDPDPADPWPRHQQDSGASIAIRAAFLRKIGGAPHVAVGEDRALIEKSRLFDARIRHASEVIVQVSGRLEGRAVGGMATTIKRRMTRPDELTDERLEPAVDAYRRAVAKARLRGIRHRDIGSTLNYADDLLISREAMSKAMQGAFFGTVWANVQRLSPVLQRRRVALTNVERETEQALFLWDQLNNELTSATFTHHQNVSAHLPLSGYEVTR